MTENVQPNENENQVTTPAVVPEAPKPLPKYTDEDVDRIVKTKKQQGYAKGYEDAKAEFQKQSAASAPTENQGIGQTAAQIPANTGLGGLEPPAQEHIKTMIEEQLRLKEQQLNAQRIVHEFASKMEAGKGKYSDFEKVVTPLQLHTIPSIVELANRQPNTADIMYDLGSNPTKVANLLMLANTNPYLADIEMRKLSESIKRNEEAQSQADVKSPLSQVKSSTVGSDNGVKTISDLRKQPWLKA